MPLAAITAIDVAFAAAVAGGIVGVAGPLSTWLVAKGQRREDKAARIYRDKLAAYQALARDAYRGRDLVGQCAEDLAKVAVTDAQARTLVDDLDEAIKTLHTAEPETLAQIAVVAPPKVLRAHRTFADDWNNAIDELLWQLDRTQAGFAAKAKPASERATAALEEPIRALRDAMREDVYN
jgi:hypothetical protein